MIIYNGSHKIDVSEDSYNIMYKRLGYRIFNEKAVEKTASHEVIEAGTKIEMTKKKKTSKVEE